MMTTTPANDYTFLLSYCGVPKRQVQETQALLGKIDIFNLPENESAYLHGSAGTGKTIAAIALMFDSLSKNKHVKYVMKKFNVLNDEFDPHGPEDLRYLYVRTPDVLSQIRATFDKKKQRNHADEQGDEQETERSIIKKYSEVDFLVLDDLGVEKITDWSFTVLYLIIDNRYNNYKQTVITSNDTLDELAKKLGEDRIPSRICGMCTTVDMNGNDYRLK